MPRNRPSRYGKLVVGEEEAARRRQFKKEGRKHIYGPAVTGEGAQEPQELEPAPSPSDPPAPGPEDQGRSLELSQEPVTAQDASLSLKELAARLKESPHLLDRQIDAEFQRAEGPRAGALRLFITLEEEREGGARADVLQILEQTLTERSRS